LVYPYFRVKASEDEKLPTATTKKQQESRSSSTVNDTAPAVNINSSQTRNYNDVAKFRSNDLHKCPICRAESKYSICIEHWFKCGRFVPTNRIEVA